jgi:hypothetical protein
MVGIGLQIVVDSCIHDWAIVLLETLDLGLAKFWRQTHFYELNYMVESSISSPFQT